MCFTAEGDRMAFNFRPPGGTIGKQFAQQPQGFLVYLIEFVVFCSSLA